MYHEYFGFKERPFQLLPNPDYLFLSKSHEEALGHLLYALSHGEGFVEISGEVGTGKTTLCRALLDSLGEEVEAAYIFHPKLDPLELLQAITGEFGISSKADTTREMIDILHRFLISKKEERKKVILIIDEAQNLTVDVLEQIRLLSNLETSTSKLIQIVLVGQPELNDLLDSHDLRQLRQRVSLRCRISPLTASETHEYIRYRLHRAGGEDREDLFSPSATTLIYRYSKGIPRLINIACDRALLLAYGADLQTLTSGVVRKALRELKESDPSHGRTFFGTRKVLAVLLSVALLLLLDSVWPRGRQDPVPGNDRSASVQQEIPTPPAPLEGPPTLPAGQPGIAPALPVPAAVPEEKSYSLDDLGEFLRSTLPHGNRDQALAIAMDLWKPGEDHQTRFSFLDNDLTFFRLNAQTGGLSVTPVSGGVSMLGHLDVPAIMEFTDPETPGSKYLTLIRISGDTFRLAGIGPTGVIEMKPGDLYGFWTGRAYVIWRNFLGLDGVIPLNSSQEAIVSLKLLLSDLGVEGLDANPVYDSATRQAVLAVQQQNGIFVDGLVGPLTAIALYNLAGTFDIPRLTEANR